MTYANRFDRTEWGYFQAVGYRGERHGLIGHDSCDVAKWLDAHPEFNGSLYFEYGDGSDQIEVTEIFITEPVDAALSNMRVGV